MSGSAPATVAHAIEGLGQWHLVSEGMLIEYIKKPTLVYISFWDDDSLSAHASRSPPPEQKYGRVPVHGINCIVENYETAFAPLLADKRAKRLYEKYRAPRSPKTESKGALSLYPRYEIRNGVEVPIDYHFLENFHVINLRDAWQIDPWLESRMNPLHDYNGRRGEEWWPNLVVRLDDIWNTIRDCEIKAENRTQAQGLFEERFGILASNRVRLQDYLILVDRKEDNERVKEDFSCFEHDQDHTENYKLLQCIKSYDLDKKLPTDLTSASIEDLRSRSSHAIRVEELIRTWQNYDLMSRNAYFVRWKRNDELRGEARDLDRRLHSSHRSGTRSGQAFTDSLHRLPVRGFRRAYDAYRAARNR
ncbi:hypothetical protein SAMD00023353_6100160 [Rosellinia necatrix]|uniref:Uncharacterized protein n=1 Tax=Rosellinia necatrix TaxID=77044 RepID=A0A1W2TTW2_ROSNE|nr:hypothetical protein SAMD00023353_6100160 [Rosellinia necatrix]